MNLSLISLLLCFLPTAVAPRAQAAAEGASTWAQLVAATRGPGLAEGPVSGLEIDAQVRTRQADGQSNDISTRFAYLHPGWVRLTLGSGRETGKGPTEEPRDSYWSRDGDEVTLLKGRQYAADRKELEQMLAINRMLLVLVNPDQLQPMDLRALPRGVHGAPEHAVGRDLNWISFRSSQLDIGPGDGDASLPPQLQGIEIGVDRNTGLPRQARVTPPIEPGMERLAPRFFSFDKFVDSQGFQLPRLIKVYDQDPASRRFRSEPTLDIVVRQSDLRPNLQPAMFLPPAK